MPKDLKEFESLVEARPAGSKTSNADLMAFLSEAMRTTKEVSKFLAVENGTAFSRLKRLEKNGVVTRRWDGPRAYWVTRKAVGLEDLPPPEPKESEEEEEDQ
jgi:DNA-binding PadR family transcriptional regulator